MTRKERFRKYIEEHGYVSMRSLAVASGIDPANLQTNLDGKWGLSVKRAFHIANTMGVPVDEILHIFYEEQYEENHDKVVAKVFEVPVE